MFISMSAIPDRESPDWRVCTVNGHDSTRKFLVDHPTLRISNVVASWYSSVAWRAMWEGSTSYGRERAARNRPLMRLIFPSSDVDSEAASNDYSFMANFSILHFRAGSNWIGLKPEEFDDKWARVNTRSFRSSRRSESQRKTRKYAHTHEVSCRKKWRRSREFEHVVMIRARCHAGNIHENPVR
jgi:hypothetical protein